MIYSWNGSQYGKWANSPQALPSGFYPRNRVDPKINAIVKDIGGKFSYSYNLNSLPSSKQMVNTFVLVTSPDSTANGAGPVDWDFGGIPSKALGWVAPPGFDVFIKPGSRDSSFYFENSRLPAIVQSLIRGDNGSWASIFGDTVEFTIDQWFDEALSNSYQLKTVGPSVHSSSMVPLKLLDTLISYCTQSRALGWIKGDSTESKYLSYFRTARTILTRRDSAGARAALLPVLQYVVSDSSSALTTEAYALILYNTEYLVNKLPQQNRTIQCSVNLLSSAGSLLPNGSLQYRDTTWENSTNNNDGTFTITTFLKKISLRMTYGNATETKSNVTVENDTVIVFQTKNVSVSFQTSVGVPLDTGAVQYYAGGWQTFGTTSNGVVAKEILPLKYTFRLTYNAASISKVQNVDSNSTVVFHTIPAVVQLQTSTGAPLDTGIVQYYSGGWRDFGTTLNGTVSKELLPTKYTFRLTYNGASVNEAQSIDSNAIVVFQTVPAKVELQTSTGVPLDTGFVEYNSGGWRAIGTTLNGIVSTELLPVKYTFRLTYNGATISEAQNIDSSRTVLFQTKNVIVQLNDSHGSPLDTGVVQYYAGVWRAFGTTANGVAAKELLPANYTFRMTYQFVSNDKAQDVSTNNTVSFSTVLCTVTVADSLNQPVNNVLASYNSGGWRQIGSTVNGQVTKELLPANLTFRITYGKSHQDKAQNLSTNNVVLFIIP
jgi:hypothetical protein